MTSVSPITRVASHATPSRSHAKPRSVSVGQVSRNFDYPESVLGQSAAEAYRRHPAYQAIEQKTLEAICPFLDLKKRERADSKAVELQSSTSPESRAYAHRRTDSQQDGSMDLSSSPFTSRDRGSSFSSISYEDFRNSVKTVYQEGLYGSTSSSPVAPLNLMSSRRQTTSSGSVPPTGPQPYNPDTYSALPRISFSNMTQPALKSQIQAPAFGVADLDTEPRRALESRLRSLSVGSAFSRRQSLSSNTSAPRPAATFALSNFMNESVRHFSPSSHEIEEKLRLKQDFELILQAIQPTASLVIFGSVRNGLNLANADLDLMVVDESGLEEQLHDLHVDLPHLYAEQLKSQGYAVKLLAKTRIPLIKVQRDYVGGAFSCDICFDNPLALHNTRLIATYAACDSRVPLLMMFIKLWARCKKINDSFGGTLKSYGYMLLLIYYLQNKISPPVLPNLQMIASTGRVVSVSELECQGHDCWFAKDVSKLPPMQPNSASAGEILEGFLSYFAYEFDYRDWVVSIRAPLGLQTKDVKNWTQLVEHLNDNGSAKVKDRYVLSIEDPFETSHNVARTVTRAGLYDIRGEFMKAIRCIRSDKLCELIEPNE